MVESTILLPVYNNPEKFLKCMSFFSGQYNDFFGNDENKNRYCINIIVLDGSDNSETAARYKEISKKNGYAYFHKFIDGSRDWYRRVQWAFEENLVTTETLLILDYEDIQSFDTFFKCVEFIENNKDYTCCTGEIYYFLQEDVVMRAGKRYIGSNIEEETGIERIWRYATTTTDLNYNCVTAVMRTSSFKRALALACEMVPEQDAFGSEFCLEMAMLFLGKYKKLSCAYKIRVKIDPRFDSWYLLECILDPLNYIGPQKIPLSASVQIMKCYLLRLVNGDLSYERIFQHTITEFILNYMHSANSDNLYSKEFSKFNLSRLQIPLQRTYKPDAPLQICKTCHVNIDISGIKPSSRIAIYGAGTLGAEIYRLLTAQKIFNFVYFIDMRYKELSEYLGERVVSLNSITNKDFDCIFIANPKYSQEISASLVKKGIDSSKILSEYTYETDVSYDTILEFITTEFCNGKSF